MQFTPINIIDPEKGEFAYSESGIGMLSSRYYDEKFYEALLFLKEATNKVPTVRINFKAGQLLSLANRETLHRKTTEPGLEVSKAIQERLLLRESGRKRH